MTFINTVMGLLDPSVLWTSHLSDPEGGARQRQREKHDAVVFFSAVAVGGVVVVAPLADGMAAARADGALRPHIRKYKHANSITVVCG